MAKQQQQQQRKKKEKQAAMGDKKVTLNPILRKLVGPADHADLPLLAGCENGLASIYQGRVWRAGGSPMSLQAGICSLTLIPIQACLLKLFASGAEGRAAEGRGAEGKSFHLEVMKLLMEAGLLLHGTDPEAGVHCEMHKLLNWLIGKGASGKELLALLRERSGLLLQAARLTEGEDCDWSLTLLCLVIRIEIVSGPAALGPFYDEVLARDPRRYYKMVEASIRRNGREEAYFALLLDAQSFKHPSAVAVIGGKGSGAAVTSRCPANFRRVKQLAEEVDLSDASTSSSSSTCSINSSTPAVLGNINQTQAFLSAVLSYRKVLWMCHGSMEAQLFLGLKQGLFVMLQWIGKEGVSDMLEAGGMCKQGSSAEAIGSGRSSNSSKRATGADSSSSSNSSGSSSSGSSGSSARGEAIDPAAAAAASKVCSSSVEPAGCSRQGGITVNVEELVACRMLALGVLARMAVTCGKLPALPDSIRTAGVPISITDGHGQSGRPSKEPHDGPEGGGGEMVIAGNFGIACYCLMKQLQQGGSSSVGDGSRCRSSSSSSPHGSASACTSGNSIRRREGVSTGLDIPAAGSSHTASSSSSGNDGSTEDYTTAAAASRQKQVGLQLDLPVELLKALRRFEAVVQGFLQEEWHQAAGNLGGLLLSMDEGEAETGQEHLKQLPLQQQHKQADQEQPRREEPSQEGRVRMQYVLFGQHQEEPSKAMLDLVGQLLLLCEEVVRWVQLPLGCINPHCTSLEGLSEADAAKGPSV